MSISRHKAEAAVKGYRKARPATLQWNFIIPLAILTLFILTAIFAPLLASYDPEETALIDRLLPPAFVHGGDSAHFLGTDTLGRDILSRLIYGSRVSLSVSLMVILITASVGTLLGITCGYADRYVPLFGGLAYLDYRGKLYQEPIGEEPFATYERLDALVPDPPLIIVFTGVARDSGDVHSVMRARYLEEHAGQFSNPKSQSLNMLEVMKQVGATAWRTLCTRPSRLV